MTLLAFSPETNETIAIVIALAAFHFLNELRSRKAEKKAEKKLNEVIDISTKNYKLNDGQAGEQKHIIAISKRNEVISLRALARISAIAGDAEVAAQYAVDAVAAEKEAVAAQLAADEHDRRLAELDETIQRRTAELAMKHSTAPELKKVATETAATAASVAESKVAADKAAETAAIAAGQKQE